MKEMNDIQNGEDLDSSNKRFSDELGSSRDELGLTHLFLNDNICDFILILCYMFVLFHMLLSILIYQFDKKKKKGVD